MTVFSDMKRSFASIGDVALIHCRRSLRIQLEVNSMLFYVLHLQQRWCWLVWIAHFCLQINDHTWWLVDNCNNLHGNEPWRSLLQMFPLPSSCRLDLRPVGIIDGDVTNIMRMLIDSRRFLECCQRRQRKCGLCWGRQLIQTSVSGKTQSLLIYC